jgi:ribonuclease HI
VPKGASVGNSGPQHPEPVEEPRVEKADGSQLPDASLGPEPHVGSQSELEQFKYMVHLDFKATNNMVEYGASIFGLSTALSLGVWQLLVKSDSQLFIKQVKGECCCNDT